MKRRQLLRLSLGLGALAGGAALAPAVTALHWGRRDLLGFGTTLSLQAGHERQAVVERALDEGVALLRRIEAQMSLFDPASALSRLIGANMPPWLSVGARQANSEKPSPAVTPRMIRSRTPRVGSTAKAWTDVSTPERTRKAPSIEKVKPASARNTVHPASAPRFSVTTAECSRAVAISQGMNEAFSTGSQNHQPPQPSS